MRKWNKLPALLLAGVMALPDHRRPGGGRDVRGRSGNLV